MSVIKEALYAPFEDIKSRRGRGGNYDYVAWSDVADRMNDVFGMNWSSEVMYQDVIGDNVVVRVRVMATSPDTGTVQYQEGFGGAPNDERAEAGNPFKAAYSKALKDACKKWGVGLHLEDDAPTPAKSNMPPGYMGKETAPVNDHSPMYTPADNPTPPETMSSNPTPPTMPGTPEPSKPQFPVDNEPQFQTSEPMTPPVSGPSGGMPVPPGVSMTMEGTTTVQQSTPEPVVDTPSAPPAQEMPTPPSVNLNAGEKPMSMNKATPINTGEAMISDVQKAALQSILNIKDVEYESLAAEAFQANGLDATSIPAPDKLTYSEAVCVVKFGNDKFRKR